MRRLIFSAMLILMTIAIALAPANLQASRGDVHILQAQKKTTETQSTTVKSGKSNSSDRAADGKDKTLTGKVIRVSEKPKTFTVTADSKEVTFDAKSLKTLPAVGDMIDITYTSSKGGQLLASSFNSSKSNASKPGDTDPPKSLTGKVLRVSDKEKTFVLLVDGKESTFSARKMKALPRVGSTVEVKANPSRFVFNSCEECNAKCPGVCFMQASLWCRCYLEPIPMN